MNNKRVLVLTGSDNDKFRDNNSTDATIKEVSEITSLSKQKFAEKHDYDFMFLRSFGKDHNNQWEENKIGQLRFLRAIEMLKDYDAVFWIDADSLITNNNYKLNDFVSEEICFAGSWDWNGKVSISTGNFVVQKTPQLEQLYSVFYKIGKFYNSEQEALNVMWRQNLVPGMIVLDHKFFGSTPTKQQYANGWEDRPEPCGPWNEECFLVHLTGVSNTRRLELINKYFKKYT
jgi:hypothetical protein